MPRITTSQSTIENDDFLETAGRQREAHMHEAMRPARESEMDARNTDRFESDDVAWRRPTNLDAPPPRPGYVQRWVRAAFRSDGDNLNWSQKLREGWQPRDPNTIPDVASYFPVKEHSVGSVVQVGGLILCEMPEARVRAREKAIRAATDRQMESVSAETDKASREGQRIGAPSIERREDIVSRVGRRPNTMA